MREPDWNEHRMLRTPERDVHICSEGCAEIGRNLRFRDRLRANAGDRKRYEETKRTLARIDWPDMNAYAAAETEVIESIIAAAQSRAGGMPPEPALTRTQSLKISLASGTRVVPATRPSAGGLYWWSVCLGPPICRGHTLESEEFCGLQRKRKS